MKYKGWIFATCPYCGYSNKWSGKFPKMTNDKPTVVICDCDDGGGCGRYFAITPHLSCSTEVYSMMEVSRMAA